jgi:leucine dehydrogenase
MRVFESIDFAAHEQVVFAADPSIGMKAIIAVHSTALGPAIGGCRIQPYEDEAAALRDVLRLSLGMTLKAAVAGVPFGGAKMVVIADPRRDKDQALLSAIGVAIERLGGRYITGEDVGTTVEDMASVRKTTAHVMGLPEALGGSGDPSPRTALGCLVGIKAAVRHRLGKTSLGGMRVSVQGLGNVGWSLCKLLAGEGALLTVSDVRGDLVQSAVQSFAAEAVSDPQGIYGVETDVFAPCALGAVINDATEPLLKTKIIAGGANNQLADEVRHGGRLKERGILYAPDYVINAGGMIQLALEKAGTLDWKEVNGRVRTIGDTLTQIFQQADRTNIAPSEAARRLAQSRLQSGVGGRVDAK